MITFTVDEQKEITTALQQAGIDACPDMQTIWIYTYTVAEEKVAKSVLKEYDCSMRLYMPGEGRGVNAKAAEFEVVKK